MSLPAEVVWYTAEDKAAPPQVAYQINGTPRTLLEAAARRGFAHVSEAILDKCLLDMRLGSKPGRAAKAQKIIESRRLEWLWGEADVARAMMHVWPAYRKEARLRRPPCPEGEGTSPDECIWDDIRSIAEALQRQQADHNQASADPAAPDQAAGISGLQDAILQLRGASAKAKKAAARGKAGPRAAGLPAARGRKRRGTQASSSIIG